MILSFQKTFVPAVVAGTKPHTIRAGQRWRAGMSIQFYRNARQKSMAKIRENGEVKAVQSIRVERESKQFRAVWTNEALPAIIIDGRELKPLECKALAKNDGFDSVHKLVAFLDNAHGLPFEGQLIHWTDLRY